MSRRVLLTVTRASVAFVLLMISLAAFGQKRAFTFEDMMKLKRVGEFSVSPDGRWVTFATVDVSLAENTRKSHLWIVPITGGEARRLSVAGEGTEDRPRFAPNGRELMFTAARNGASQIYIAKFDAAKGELGAARQLTSISTEADGGTWSADSSQVLFTSAVWPKCSDDACNKAKDEAVEKSKVKGRVFDELMYRHWNAFDSGKRSHLFVISAGCDAAKEKCAGRDLTPGEFDVPPFSLGGQDQYQFSPDGREVAYTSNHDKVQATSTNSDVWVLSIVDAMAKAKNLTEANKGSDSTPMYSPDGKWIAMRSQFRAGYESDRFRLQLIERATGKITNLTESFDRWVESMAWAADSKTLYITAEDAGDAPIYRVAIDGGKPIEIERGFNDSPTPTADGKLLVFARNSVKFPNEIYSLALMPGAKAQKITHVNDAVLDQISMQPVEPFWFTGSENKRVEGFLLKPPSFDEKKKYPVKFLIHGGPQGAWGDDWSFRWNPNLFAASGYVVVMVNPRGSTGYGQEFVDDVNGDWGGRPFQDLMMGLDYAERKFSFIDRERECALGASYGGYMANWVLGHTDRFRCIVSHDGMFNPVSAYGATEELWFNEWEFKGTPWSNPELYDKWSPAQAAANFHTPTLVVHGQLDYRLDVAEGFQLFTTLQRLNVPSRMLYFPDEGHWVLKPQNSELWYKTVNGWVDWFTKPGARPKTVPPQD